MSQKKTGVTEAGNGEQEQGWTWT